MGKSLLLGIIILLSNELYSQNLSVKIDKPAALPDREVAVSDSILLKKDALEKNLTTVKESPQATLVYSEKQWKLFADSLRNLAGVNVPTLPDTLSFLRTVPEEELLQRINKEFFSAVNTSPLPDPARAQDSLQSIVNTDQYKDKVPSKDEVLSNTGLEQLKLPQYTLQDLSPLSGNLIKSKYLKGLDSIRHVRLKESRLKLEEKKLSAQSKLSAFKKRPTFWDRSYFEGVLGLSMQDFTILQASPSLGYHFTSSLSLGAGPNILLRQEERKILTTVGVRSFAKAEFFKHKLYAQLEDIMASYSRTSEKGNKILDNHNLFAGGGYLLSMSPSIALNLSLLYQITGRDTLSYTFSPMVFRIGISTITLKK